MSLKVVFTPIAGLLVLEPEIFFDERGSFCEAFNIDDFESATGHQIKFIQDNQSFSKAGVLRGLHFQAEPHGQSKLVRCPLGAIYDVAVDLRVDSPTYLQWFGIELSSDNFKQLWIPAGFAHGFLALKDSLVIYKVDAARHGPSEQCIRYDDPLINIHWPDTDIPEIISMKDQAPLFMNLGQSPT